eukprot:scaffold17710_cov92-Phaeocystis_antarctica.AAC.3
MPAAVHRRHCLARAAAHLKRAALKQRTLHPSRATLLQHQRLQEEHAAQRRARRRGGGRGRACRASRLQIASARENNAPTHDVVGHERVQRPGHRRTEEGGAARGSWKLTLNQRVGGISPCEGAPTKAGRRAAAHARRHDIVSGIPQQRVRDRAAVPERRDATQALQACVPLHGPHRRQLHRPKGHLPGRATVPRDKTTSSRVRPASPAAGSRWPMLALTPPTAACGSVMPSAPSKRFIWRRASISAETSVGSPRAVPVPCASS